MGSKMSDIVSRIETLLAVAEISGAKMSDDLGMSRSFMTELRKGRAKSITIETAAKIADYFGVSVDYLLGGDEGKEKAPAIPDFTRKDQRDIAKDLEAIIHELENSESLMFDGSPLSDEAKESILAAMRLGIEAAKAKNKERFTPKKYRKD